ncbi:MAG: arginine--tRNA ligase [Candidatus Altiarchaeota archaeon]|nr:arginine--tRNA ligase [Candidatus Altiarchaeota archaeon]
MRGDIKEDIKKLIEKASGESLLPGEVRESSVADYESRVAFRLAGGRKKSPAAIAEEIASGITPGGPVKKVESASGYINFFVDYGRMLHSFLSEVRDLGPSYGAGESRGIKIVLEHTSINPSGPLHIGRLRNCLIGDSLARILRFSGYDVETHYFVNDVGKQIAIIAQGFSEGVERDNEAAGTYAKYAGKEDFKVFFEYVAANKRFESDAGFAERVQEGIRRAEGGDKEALEKISSVARRCLQGQKEAYERLGVRFDFFDCESDYIKNGDVKKVIEFLGKSGYAKRTDKGLGLDLSPHGVARRDGVSILARTDGTSVYLSRDVAYHLHKIGLGDLLINVLGEDHKFEFIELKTILGEIYGIEKPLEAVHYSFVSFEGAELSTRKGRIASVDMLLDEAEEKAEAEILKRDFATTDVAPAIAQGAIKYHLLKASPNKPLTFRWNEALSFEGEAAPYIQYAHARCCNILNKTGTDIGGIDIGAVDTSLEANETALVKSMLRFRDIVKRCAEERRPNIVASYLHELAACYSRFYKECPVLSSEEKVRARRLLLVDASRQVLCNGLGLLGIDAPERM